MNAVAPPRRATPEEIAAAAEFIIPKDEFDRACQAAQRRRAREERRRRWANLGRGALVFVLAGAVVAEGIALAALAPAVRVEPVFVYLRDDGTMISSRSWRDMPSGIRDLAIFNVLSEYVTLREGYSSGEAERAWNVVSALSTKIVREQFQRWYHRDNPESPQRRYGERSSVVVEVTDIQKEQDRAGAYRVYFNRTLRTPDSPGRPEPMVATLRIQDVGNPAALPWAQRIRFNAPAIVVWEYPGARPALPSGVLPR